MAVHKLIKWRRIALKAFKRGFFERSEQLEGSNNGWGACLIGEKFKRDSKVILGYGNFKRGYLTPTGARLERRFVASLYSNKPTHTLEVIQEVERTPISKIGYIQKS